MCAPAQAAQTNASTDAGRDAGADVLAAPVVRARPAESASSGSAAPSAVGVAGNSAAEQPLPITEVIVTEGRLPVAAAGQVRVRLNLEGAFASGRTLDALLTAVPGVSLFRRTSSQTAHPTTQGLSLRGISANGAGRALVTLDGIPISDPFGGWAAWSAIEGLPLQAAHIIKGGTAGAFGAQALSGAVVLESARPQASEGYARFAYGQFDTLDVAAGYTYANPDQLLGLYARVSESDGPYLVDEASRGPADARYKSSVQSLTLRGEQALTDTLTAYATLRLADEDRVNGGVGADNSTQSYDGSVRLTHAPASGLAVEASFYWRKRDFENIFTSLSDDRATASPVLDQYDVPANGIGGLVRLKWGAFEVGVDAQRLSGETNEAFRNLGAGFTRARRAGGEQRILGGYAAYSTRFGAVALDVSLRLDHWRTYSAQRVEYDLTGLDLPLLPPSDSAFERAVFAGTLDGQGGFIAALPDSVLVGASETLRREAANASDFVSSGRVGLVWSVTPAVDARFAAFKSWRLPTLNEFYRPFRVRNDITEANANLDDETLLGIEVGLDYEPLNSVFASATVYWSDLRDGVSNVTIAEGPGVFPLAGFVPAGGVLRQRVNIDRQSIFGVELEARLRLSDGWQFGVQYAYASTRVERAFSDPSLEGLRPPQVPRHSARADLRYSHGPWQVGFDAQYQSNRFEDDRESRPLGSAFVVSGHVSRALTHWLRASLSAENIFASRVLSAVTADGFETLAQPRQLRAGLEARF